MMGTWRITGESVTVRGNKEVCMKGRQSRKNKSPCLDWQDGD